MKFLKKFCITALLVLTLVAPTFSFVETKEASAATLLGTKTGYTKADDFDYVKVKVGKYNYIANWGARDETCVFLSRNAEDFYTGSYTYENLSKKKGSSTESSVPSSALYTSLQALMSSKQTYTTSYDATKELYRYTDCVNSKYSNISSFYSAKQISGSWNGEWNREHTWPNSKGDKSGSGENDIMMLRPTSTSENSSRGNTAYGIGSGYYDPNEEGQSLRGDCARIVLFVYVRWKCTNTGSKYNPNGITGTNGVIQSIDTLLQWMKDDPVDTWEMGRNDAVQSITGTRNVFVDYPEYAWLLFGEAIPSGMVTPSGNARGGTTTPPVSSEESSSSESVKPDSSTESVVPDSSVEDSSEADSSTESIVPDDSSEEEACEHEFTSWITMKPATETEDGERRRVCTKCNHLEKEVIPKICEHEFTNWITTKPETETEDGERRRVCTKCNHLEKEVMHQYSEWITTKPATETETGERSRGCTRCYHLETETIPMIPVSKDEVQGCASTLGVSMGSVLFALASCVAVDRMRKKKNK